MKTFYLVAALLLLSACAPQKYQTRYAYTAPVTQNGAVCIQRCNTQQNQCKQRFFKTNNQCQQRAKQQAMQEMPGRIAAYEQAINIWEVRMERYERELRWYKLRRNNFSILDEIRRDCQRYSRKNNRDCRRYWPRWRSSLWFDKPNYPGKAPRRPTLKAVTAAMAAKTCPQRQCGVDYNQCYTACGGTVKPYRILLK